MARSLEIRVRCDLCQREATRTDVLVAIKRMPRRSLDLCELHYTELIEPLVKVLRKHGADVKTGETPPNHRQNGKRAIGPFLCQECTSAPLKHAGTLEVHLRRLHKMTLAEYTEKHGLTPLTREELAALEIEVRCDQPGCYKVYSLSRGNRWPQMAMVSHMWGHHAIKWSPGSK